MEKELVEHIARNLVNDPSAVQVNRREARNSVILELHVAQDDMGRVIGKSGRVANAIRALLRAQTSHSHKRVILEID